MIYIDTQIGKNHFTCVADSYLACADILISKINLRVIKIPVSECVVLGIKKELTCLLRMPYDMACPGFKRQKHGVMYDGRIFYYIPTKKDAKRK